MGLSYHNHDNKIIMYFLQEKLIVLPMKVTGEVNLKKINSALPKHSQL